MSEQFMYKTLKERSDDAKRISEAVNKLNKKKRTKCCNAPIEYAITPGNHVPSRRCIRCKQVMKYFEEEAINGKS